MSNTAESLRSDSNPLAGEILEEDEFQEFVAEVRGQLEVLEVILIDDVLGSEERLAAFRAYHTIKGAAGLCGFPHMEELAHLAEQILETRKKFEELGPELLAGLRLTWTEADAVMTALVETRAEPHLHAPTIKKIRRIATEAGVLGIRSGIPRVSLPTPPLGQLLIVKGLVTETDVSAAHSAQLAGDPRRLGEILVANGKVSPEDILQALHRQKNADRLQRAETRPLDGIADGLDGALARLRTLVADTAPAESVLNELAVLSRELKGLAARDRHTPIENIWRTLKNVAGTLANREGKELAVESIGGGVSLCNDKANALKSAAIHVLRNAIDHGLEQPAERLAAGKTARARLSFEAKQSEHAVEITMRDDGRGIDPAAVLNKAVEKNCLGDLDPTSLSDEEQMNLVFLPGFSTSEKVSSLSGRGVGMNAVRHFIESVGGSVSLTSKVGQGTTVHIRLPD